MPVLFTNLLYKRDQTKQNKAHRGCSWIKMSSQTFDQLSSLSSQLPFVGMEQCYKAGWDALQVSFLDATTATFRQLFKQSKIFYLIHPVFLCTSSEVLYCVNNKENKIQHSKTKSLGAFWNPNFYF